jgi:hypothetical protein
MMDPRDVVEVRQSEKELSIKVKQLQQQMQVGLWGWGVGGLGLLGGGWVGGVAGGLLGFVSRLWWVRRRRQGLGCSRFCCIKCSWYCYEKSLIFEATVAQNLGMVLWVQSWEASGRGQFEAHASRGQGFLDAKDFAVHF